MKFVLPGLVALLLAGCAATPRSIYIAASGRDGGIYRLSPELAGAARVADQANLAYLAATADRLYAAGAIGAGAVGVSAYKIRSDGTLALLNSLPAPGGKGYCHLTLSPDGRFLYGASYSGGTVDEFALTASGELESCRRSVAQSGQSLHKRQRSAHPHFVGFDRQGEYLISVDLGADSLFAYRFTLGRGIDPVAVKSPVVPAGSGPRHLIFSPGGERACTINELGNSVGVFDYAGGRFTARSVVPLLGARWAGRSFGGALKLDPGGKYLYATNRGRETVTQLRLDGGGARVLREIPANGKFPYDLEFVSNGVFVLLNSRSHSLVVFDLSFGTPTARPGGIGVDNPVCAVRNYEL